MKSSKLLNELLNNKNYKKGLKKELLKHYPKKVLETCRPDLFKPNLTKS